MARKKILYLTANRPQANAFGGQIRTQAIIKALEQIGDVSVVLVDYDAEERAVDTTMSATPGDLIIPRKTPGTLGSKLRYWLDARLVNANGYETDRVDRQRVLARAKESDLVWFHNLRTANVFGEWRWPRSVLDIDDIPSSYDRTVFRNPDSCVLERSKAGLRALAAARRERWLGDRFTVLSVCSEADRRYLGGGKNIQVIPNGFERPTTEPQPEPVIPPRIGFIGLFDFAPNLEGMRWFVRECWPKIKQAVPLARLRLVGKGTDGELKPGGPDIDGLGWVADPAREIAGWSSMIVPLHLGAGTRVKIAEAFSRKCPLVSTRLGAYGYDVVDGRELRLADSPRAFADACIALLQQPDTAAAMAERAWNQFLAKWTWESIMPRIQATAEDCFQRGEKEFQLGD